MENEIIEGDVSPTQLEALADLVIKRMGNAAPVVAAKAVEVNSVLETAISKDFVASKSNVNKFDYKDPIAEGFERLATLNKSDFGKYTSNKYMDDPQGSLREVWEAGPNAGKYKVSDQELGKMCNALLFAGNQKQADSARKGVGLERHFHETGTSAGILALQKSFEQGAFGDNTSILSKALDTTSGSGSDGGYLIRTDLDPFLYEIYLRSFPLYDEIQKYPANGIVHTYNQRTSPGTASLVDELGDLTAAASASVFARGATSHIAVMVAYRGISLKLQYAVRQSGMNYDLQGPNNLEINGAMNALANLNQTQILQGNFSSSGKTKDDEEGAYDLKGFDGLRLLLKPAGTSITKASTQSYRNVFDQAVGGILNAGGNVNNIRMLGSAGAKIAINEELLAFIRMANNDPSAFNGNPVSGGLLNLTDNINKFQIIPSSSQTTGTGYYTISAVDYEDVTLVDPQGIGLAYLGSPTPMVLQLPIGFNGALSNVYIIFCMNGLTVPALNFHRKVRIPKQTVLY